jgi:hypothetical protein
MRMFGDIAFELEEPCLVFVRYSPKPPAAADILAGLRYACEHTSTWSERYLIVDLPPGFSVDAAARKAIGVGAQGLGHRAAVIIGASWAIRVASKVGAALALGPAHDVKTEFVESEAEARAWVAAQQKVAVK